MEPISIGIGLVLLVSLLTGCSGTDLEKQVEENTNDINRIEETLEDYESYKNIVEGDSEEIADLKLDLQNHELKVEGLQEFVFLKHQGGGIKSFLEKEAIKNQ